MFQDDAVGLTTLPNELLYELSSYLEAADLFALTATNRLLRHFLRSPKSLWYRALCNLGEQHPLALPPAFTYRSTTVPTIKLAIARTLRFKRRWDAPRPSPTNVLAHHLSLPPLPGQQPEPMRINMMRLLPGAKQLLTSSHDARIACWDVKTGAFLGEWRHGGVKVESVDVDVVTDRDDLPSIVLAVSVEHHYAFRDATLATYRLHTVRIDIQDIPGSPIATFRPLSETCWKHPLYIVSLEGDYASAYSCAIGAQPLQAFTVIIMNWKTQTAARVIIEPDTISFHHWPTMQVLGNQIILLEERQTDPAACVIRIPQKMYPVIRNIAAPITLLEASVVQPGGEVQICHQTRFSKRWRTQSDLHSPRQLTLLSISEQANEQGHRRIQLRKFVNPLETIQGNGTLQAIPSQASWMEYRPSLHRTGVSMFIFCLGRYGMRPLWIEQDTENRLSLHGLTSNAGNAKVIDIPNQVDLTNCRFVDWDDAEGVLCTLDREFVWIFDFAA